MGENIYNITKKAFEIGEFYELLTGRKEYVIPVLDASADVPTDWTNILSDGIHQLYLKIGI